MPFANSTVRVPIPPMANRSAAETPAAPHSTAPSMTEVTTGTASFSTPPARTTASPYETSASTTLVPCSSRTVSARYGRRGSPALNQESIPSSRAVSPSSVKTTSGVPSNRNSKLKSTGVAERSSRFSSGSRRSEVGRRAFFRSKNRKSPFEPERRSPVASRRRDTTSIRGFTEDISGFSKGRLWKLVDRCRNSPAAKSP